MARTRKMACQVKVLAIQTWDLRSNPQHPYKKQNIINVCNPSTVGELSRARRTTKACWLPA